MGYLVTHMAAYLIFAQLLGLLLGWLLWGYTARQRAGEVQSLRERIADLQVSASRMAHASLPRASLEPPGEALATEPEKPEVEPGMADRPTVEGAGESTTSSGIKPIPIQQDLLSEVKEARLRHFEKRVHELEGFRDRVTSLEAALHEAVAGRRSAESKLETVQKEFAVRSARMLEQIQDFQRAAVEWDQARGDFERARIAQDKELSAVRAQLRDLQNNQLPQRVEPAAALGFSELEHADLRDRYQRALKERDAMAAELEAWKQSPSGKHADSERVAELDAMLRLSRARLDEQLAQVETLLWRVAELEPYAAAMPQMEDDLRRQEAEIAGHVAMHTESSEHIRSLLNRVAQLEPAAAKAGELAQELARRSETIDSLASRVAGLESERFGLEAKLSAQEAGLSRAKQLEQALSQRDAEIRGLLAAHADFESELLAVKSQVAELESLAAKAPEAERKLARLEEETRRQIDTLEMRHQAERTRLKMNSAQRLRRLRQSIANYKG